MKRLFYYLGCFAVGLLCGHFANSIKELILFLFCGFVLWSGLYVWSEL